MFHLPWPKISQGHELHIIDDSCLYSETPNSVGHLWTSDQPDTDTATG